MIRADHSAEGDKPEGGELNQTRAVDREWCWAGPGRDRMLNAALGRRYCECRWRRCTGAVPAHRSPLRLAESKWPNLTRAERALLENADVKNAARGEFGAAGPSTSPDDPSNDPAKASEWDVQREIRASLIRWMYVDPDAIRPIDPRGIQVLGARIIGTLNLSQVHVPFPITLRNCAIPEALELSSTVIPALSLQGSYTGSDPRLRH